MGLQLAGRVLLVQLVLQPLCLEAVLCLIASASRVLVDLAAVPIVCFVQPANTLTVLAPARAKTAIRELSQCPSEQQRLRLATSVLQTRMRTQVE